MAARRLTLALLVGANAFLSAQSPTPADGPRLSPTLYQDLRYRVIGPFRAGRTVGAVGIPTQPNVFFMGVNNGGVWKTDDYGRTWRPVFDAAPTGSIGDLAVSPSHPDTIYVGTGEGLHRPDLGVGDGIFKSTDGGATWQHAGLPDVQQVGRIVVDPTNPDIVFVAGMGHPYGPNEERGVFRTRDGGRSWEKVLYVDANTGANQVEVDANDPRTIYAALWEHREGPWENASFSGSNSGLYKSVDGGSTWRKLAGGLPDAARGVGRINFAIAPSDSRRAYAMVGARDNAGLYRSDDGGETWSLASADPRLSTDIRVHPKNRDTVFVANIAAYRSDDRGRTWTSFKGAPGGDDYQRLWINPLRPEIMLITADQGAVVTVNGGRTWSSWYNQPTAQLYHVTTDNRFPYWVYGGQQESGAIGIASRGNGGQISFRDWIGVGADEYAYVAPDPLDPDIVYGGRVMRFNRRTGQAQFVAPETLRPGDYRILRTMPLMFHPADKKTLLFASNVLWKTTTGGQRWEAISPDLSREHPGVPDSVGTYRTPEMDAMARRGVIYALGPSPLDPSLIWAGTDDGLVHVTRDGGGTWTNVTPPGLRAWDKVSQIDAGHFDTRTAYVAINAIRRDDMRPHVYRTHDGGLTWQRVVAGLPDMGPVNVVREDPKRPWLLFAGTEREVYFSVDDGDRWQSLRLNMPASSVRDLVIKDDDLVVGTHGRSIWILDGITMLRDLAARNRAEVGSSRQPGALAANPAEAGSSQGALLFTPPLATRVRDNMFADTPLPPDEPTGANPPEGALLDYYLPGAAREVVLEIVASGGEIVRRFASSDPPERVDFDKLQYPEYWMRPPRALPATPGHHRVTWDLRYPPPPGAPRELTIAATPRNTPTSPRGPFVHPGKYTVRLTADGTTLERPLVVRMDPRVQIAEADLRLQTDLSLTCYRTYLVAQKLRDDIDAALGGTGAAAPAVRRAPSQAQALRGGGTPREDDVLYGHIVREDPATETVVGLQQKLLFVLAVLQGADGRPTEATADAVWTLAGTLPELQKRWAAMQ